MKKHKNIKIHKQQCVAYTPLNEELRTGNRSGKTVLKQVKIEKNTLKEMLP